jgi:hypothetical protein
MKTFNRTHLPESINYNNSIYTYYSAASSLPFEEFQRAAKIGLIKVNVLSTRLKNVTDFSGKKYKPSSFYFIKTL